jgi:hypothetical protein
MGNRRIMLVGGLGVTGVVVCALLVVSAMRSGNTPETVVVNDGAATPEPKKMEPFVPSLGSADAEGSPAETVADKRSAGAGGKTAGTLRRGSKQETAAMDVGRGFWEQAKVSKAEAREALATVGADSNAEAVWWMAINDMSLDPEVRRDLIEDLNEDGFTDPKHPRKEDLPLIESRISLIEELAREPMDDVNGEAFAEAYKDLLNMRRGLMGR